MTESMRERLDQLLDADRDEFDSEEDYRDYIDGQIARLDMLIDETESDLGAVDARTDALSKKLSLVEERARRAERMAAWGGVGYSDRVRRVVETLVRRAEQNVEKKGTAGHREWVHRDYITPRQDERHSPGIYEVLDGAVSLRTSHSYMHDLDSCPGFRLQEAQPGGWGGGCRQMRLYLDLERFVERYGSEWSVEEIIEDMEVEEP